MLHDDVTKQTGGVTKYSFYAWLTVEIEKCLEAEKCKEKSLLNHLRYFVDDPCVLSQLGMDIQCTSCKQWFSERSFPRHEEACMRDPFNTWRLNHTSVPYMLTGKDKRMYFCIICGAKSPTKKKLICHLSQHYDGHLRRFNLDVVLSYQNMKRSNHG